MTATVSRIGQPKVQPKRVIHLNYEPQQSTARSEQRAAVQQWRATNPKWVARAKTEAKTLFVCMAIGAVVGFVFGFIAKLIQS